jgi:L-amino acid N-acyltransferase YncA
MEVRFAHPEDCMALLGIYANYINSPVTFECELPTKQEFRERIEGILMEYPYLICEQKGRVIGYAYAHRHRERAAYHWNAELSIYFDPAETNKGYGGRLYRILIELLRLQGVKNIYAGVTLPNPASERLHASLGFCRIGVERSTGYKGGRWHDVAWFEKQIAPYDVPPVPIVPIHRIPQSRLESILRYQGE